MKVSSVFVIDAGLDVSALDFSILKLFCLTVYCVKAA